MPAVVYLAAICLASSLPLLIWSLAGVRGSTARVRQNLRSSMTIIARPVSSLRRPNIAARLLPSTYVNGLDRRLDRAGISSRWTAARYLAAKAIGIVVALIVGGFIGLRSGGTAVIFVPVLSVAAAWLLPDLRLGGKAKARELEIELQLPDVLDQLTISIEAGLGFDAAMARLVETTEGPVVDQLARVLQDVRLGLSRDGALRGLAARTGSADLRTFANAMAQAGKHGLAMATVLRAQTIEVREKRKFRAEERANKIPVKILIPLVLCVLPTLFIVLLGPAVMRYTDGFG